MKYTFHSNSITHLIHFILSHFSFPSNLLIQLILPIQQYYQSFSSISFFLYYPSSSIIQPSHPTCSSNSFYPSSSIIQPSHPSHSSCTTHPAVLSNLLIQLILLVLPIQQYYPTFSSNSSFEFFLST